MKKKKREKKLKYMKQRKYIIGNNIEDEEEMYETDCGRNDWQ